MVNQVWLFDLFKALLRLEWRPVNGLDNQCNTEHYIPVFKTNDDIYQIDPDYLKFLESLTQTENESIPAVETFLEEIEVRERELKGE